MRGFLESCCLVLPYFTCAVSLRAPTQSSDASLTRYQSAEPCSLYAHTWAAPALPAARGFELGYCAAGAWRIRGHFFEHHSSILSLEFTPSFWTCLCEMFSAAVFTNRSFLASAL